MKQGPQFILLVNEVEVLDEEALEKGGFGGIVGVGRGSSAIPTIPDNPNANVSTGGSYTTSIDSSPYIIDNAIVAYVKAEALTTLTVASPSNVGGKGIVVVLDDSGGVSGLTIGIEGGQRIGYIEGSPVGSAEATIDGSTYTITGNAPYVDTSTPAASGLKSYDITITCS